MACRICSTYDNAVLTGPGACLPHAGIVLKTLNGWVAFTVLRLLSANPTLYFKAIQISPKIWVLPTEILSQTLYFDSFSAFSLHFIQCRQLCLTVVSWRMPVFVYNMLTWIVVWSICLSWDSCCECGQDKEPKGIIPLENVQVSEVTASGYKPHCFEIHSSGNDVIKACKTDSEGKVVEGKRDWHLFNDQLILWLFAGTALMSWYLVHCVS